MYSSKASISINNQRQHTNISESVLSAFHTPALQAHIYQRTGWSHSTYNKVDWDLTHTYMSSLNDIQRTNAVKYLHDWQNTGSQNLKFQASEMDKPDAPKAYTESHTACPFNCGALETPLHYLYCPSIPARHASSAFLSSIQCTIKKEHTALPVYNAVMQHLKHHLHQPTSPTPVQPPTTPQTLHDIIQEAIHDQVSIGWHHFLKGRISKLWSSAQRTCYAQRTDLDKRKYTILRWRKRLTKSIIEGCITP